MQECEQSERGCEMLTHFVVFTHYFYFIQHREGMMKENN